MSKYKVGDVVRVLKYNSESELHVKDVPARITEVKEQRGFMTEPFYVVEHENSIPQGYNESQIRLYTKLDRALK